MDSAGEDASRRWLVTRDGERIETRGPWRQEGSRVLFVAPNGSLVSIRAEEVDLEASRKASEPEAEDDKRPAQPLPDKADLPPPRLVLTDLDIPPMNLAEAGPSEGAADATSGAPATATTPGLAVVEWRNVGGDEGPLQIFGTVRNDGPRERRDVSVVVSVFDDADNEIGRQNATLQSTTLGADQSTSFRVSFPEIFAFDRVELEAGGG